MSSLAVGAAILTGHSRGSVKRVDSRVAHRVPCRLRAAAAAGGEPVTLIGETVNFSPRGVAIQLSRAIEQGTQVELLIPHLWGEPTCLYGTVVHSRRVLSGTFEVGIHVCEG